MTVFLNPGEGMVIGAVDGAVITDETSIDYDQWEDGKPWHTKTSTQTTT
jgi:hypothetical protein